MPGRQSHGGLFSKQTQIRANNKKRSINAFAIAVQQNPESVKLRQHRLGNIEEDNRPAKRVKTVKTSEDGGDISNGNQQRKKTVKARSDGLDVDAGSDSDGNEWRMGYVDNDDDSDLDSNEAFGDSDEEKFGGFAFSGSSTQGKVQKIEKNVGFRGMTLLENDSELESASENDSLDDDAIDLAAMLDATEGDNQEDTKDPKGHGLEKGEDSEEESLNSEPEKSDDGSSISSMEDNDTDDPEKIAAIRNLISSLPQTDESKALLQKSPNGAGEYKTPSDFGINPKAKLTLEDLGLPSIRDPFVKKSLKLLALESKGDSSRKSKTRKLDVPLAKRQQDRLDRSAAYEKSRDTLNKWTDTVKHNRRAEHLTFPLPDTDTASANANSRLQPTTNSKTFTDLEATIQTILEESGLAAANGKDDEDRIMEFEELEANKMSLEEVQARRAQLRIARDLLFREEARAKRIKKIKSKSYRKVRRKQREKESHISRQALIEAGVEPSDDEQEIQDRRRAEERMGAKHRDSKWARVTKLTSRGAWDEDARAGITEMARRDEELRKRVEGRPSRKSSTNESESSGSDTDNENLGDEDVEQTRLLHKPESVGMSNVVPSSGPGSKLSNMKFMLKAEASRKKENDETIEKIRKDLAGESGSDDNGNDFAQRGRRTFGPGSGQVKDLDTSQAQKFNEFEEPQDSVDEDDVNIYTKRQDHEIISQNARSNDERRSISGYKEIKTMNLEPTTRYSGNGAWSNSASQKDKTGLQGRRQRLKRVADVEELDIENAAVISKPAQPKNNLKARQAILGVDDSNEEDNDRDDAICLPYAIRDQELIKRAFAGADVVGEFEDEKRQTIMDEGEKIIDNTLPGWGNWVGDGISKKDKRQNKGRFLSRSEGIKEQDRKDAKLDRVIINQKRVKKNGKYLASNLPHPFESRQQYERSLRLPVGPEWTTKETFQDATKPRILMKQGIIAPMLKPLF